MAAGKDSRREARIGSGADPQLEGIGIAYHQSSDIVADARTIIDSAQAAARRAVNVTLVVRNWLLGRRIAEEELQGKGRADYGKQIVAMLSKELSSAYGKGFGKQELYKYVQFYNLFPEIVDSVSRQSRLLLTWTHYRELLRVTEADARAWYVREAAEQAWSVRTLKRNIDTQYYQRLLLSGDKPPVVEEMERNTAPYQTREFKQAEFIKDPYMIEFLGLPEDERIRESALEAALLANLQSFLLELGKGYAFMGRQFHLRGISGNYYIDLVFYNVILKCYVLIDLKVGKVTHQDVGQMDMYVRMFDDFYRRDDDNPTLGIVLCSDTDTDIARYSVLSGSEQLFASRYKLYLPTDEELRAEIENQKALFERQAGDRDNVSDFGQMPTESEPST
ncbi:DUF1016 domain-containing protein [Collinsella tanakaei]|uniref:PDDEXK nuclease domain-containing protein n=1 Tax=Collinsella tanakaei TaxID=626935 RepID=UPI0019577776|nr:PDDEXK nuclease domain-containing protein [Collinsella tanakaei]MBM6779057.1 DUF1016 domain-containing protein [Collinsella tanakaei]